MAASHQMSVIGQVHLGVDCCHAQLEVQIPPIVDNALSVKKHSMAPGKRGKYLTTESMVA